MSEDRIAIRTMTDEDAPAVRRLLSQLGYPLACDEVIRRCRAVSAASDHLALIVEQEDRVVAFCHAFGRPALDKPPEVVVQALVVDQECRGTGVGKAAMRAVEAWALAHGFTSVSLASSVARKVAHDFYYAIGYRRIATSHLFRNNLGQMKQ